MLDFVAARDLLCPVAQFRVAPCELPADCREVALVQLLKHPPQQRVERRLRVRIVADDVERLVFLIVIEELFFVVVQELPTGPGPAWSWEKLG